ncbi:MAG: hypothetical protein JWL77_3551 [Chthonomonadaceae bacterium]|nr:hypothetical protein [Chthonomonadaceae bacterium]
MMFRLPVSQIGVEIRPPSGEEDLLLLEAPRRDRRLTVALASRLTTSLDAALAPIDWPSLCFTDLDAFLIGLRQSMRGDRIRTDTRCPRTGCGARVDVDFRLSDYLAHYAPRVSRQVEKDAEAGWFRLRDAPAAFRLVTVSDEIAIAYQSLPEEALALQCLRPGNMAGPLRRRVERAMASLAPCLENDIDGLCPECGARIALRFDPQEFILRELQQQAASLYEDVHLLAKHYHWSELQILALPHTRRTQYADRIWQERKSV